MDKLQQITKDTPIAMITVGQLEDHLTPRLTEHLLKNLFPAPLLEILAKYTEIEEKNTKRYEYGVGGIKRLFHCSYPTAHKTKRNDTEACNTSARASYTYRCGSRS